MGVKIYKTKNNFISCKKDMDSEEVRSETVNYSTARKVAIIIMAAIEALSIGLIIFGWSSLVYVYQQEGVYSYLCDLGNGTTMLHHNRYHFKYHVYVML